MKAATYMYMYVNITCILTFRMLKVRFRQCRYGCTMYMKANAPVKHRVVLAPWYTVSVDLFYRNRSVSAHYLPFQCYINGPVVSNTARAAWMLIAWYSVSPYVCGLPACRTHTPTHCVPITSQPLRWHCTMGAKIQVCGFCSKVTCMNRGYICPAWWRMKWLTRTRGTCSSINVRSVFDCFPCLK